MPTPQLPAPSSPAAQMEPVLRQLSEEAGRGSHVPVTSFADRCTLHDPPGRDA